ncbi:MAG: DNA translocase FtsK [Bacteroidia bacterium]|nr:DNA translocase FtsK [Bacteroidia bacterium]MDW8416550.1 DNA translocase FtsK [Bacteroidia bacterium]
MAGTDVLSRRRMLLSLGVGIAGLYILTAVLAYFASYTEDLPALEGAPTAVPLQNPTGWLGAKIAHRLVYRGFGWVGILFPIGLLYIAFKWSQRRPVPLRALGWGAAVIYLAATFGGWLVQAGWVEDLIWCGSVGAAFAAWLSLYIGSVGLFITWLALLGAAGVAFIYPYIRLRNREAQPPPINYQTASSSPEAEEQAPNPSSLWYEVVHNPIQPPTPPFRKKDSPSETDSQVAILTPPAEEEPLNPTESELDLEIIHTDTPTPSEQVHSSEYDAAENPVRDTNTELRATGLPRTEEPRERKPAITAASPQHTFPPLYLLSQTERSITPPISPEELEAHKEQIVRTLRQYGIELTRITATVGPTVTLFEVVPAPGIRISRIKSLEDDIALSLAALGIRIIAPMPGKGTIGIEVPNARPRTVPLSELLEAPEYQKTSAQLPLAIGKTITGEAFVRDLAQMPHLLIAGATGQGKSVALNCMILSLLYKRSPDEVRLVLIDPKKVEMSLYQGLEEHYLARIPGLPERIITEVKHALPALQSLVQEMEMRYELLKELRVRNITEYNRRCREGQVPEGHHPLPYIVLIIDELADLMMTAGKEVETPICRLAQLARAVGIHLIVATQRPSVNVITGLIKANFPVRISFRVVSRVDSRVILDDDGAERLIGRGDMLFAMGTEMIRLQSGFVSTSEIESVVEYIQRQPIPVPYELPEPPAQEASEEESPEDIGERDPLFYEAALLIVRNQYGSTSLLQRKLGVGFNRAGRLMDQLERAGIVGPARGSKPREVLIQDESQLEVFR